MRIAFLVSATESGVLHIECDQVLHSTTSDLNAYKNAWGTHNSVDSINYAQGGTTIIFSNTSTRSNISAQLAAMLCALLSSDTTGVEHVRVTTYTLEVHHSRAVPATELEALVKQALADLRPPCLLDVVKSTAEWDLPDELDGAGLVSDAMLGGTRNPGERRGLFGR